MSCVSLLLMGTWSCATEERPPVDGFGGYGNTTHHGGDGDGDSPDTEETDTSTEETDTSTDPGDGDTGSTLDDDPPDVEVLAPEPDVVLTESVEVICKVIASDDADAYPLDVTSIVAQILDDEGVVLQSQPVSAGSSEFEYTATFHLGDLEPGAYDVGCVASSTSPTPTPASAYVAVLYDEGPTIQPITPEVDAAMSAAGVHNFEFRIQPSFLFEDDTDAELEGNPTVLIDGVDFELRPKPGTEDVYWLEAVDFNDEESFDVPPQDETHLVVRATNGRAVVGELDYSIFVDSDAPVVTVASPATGSIVGREFRMVFNVQDAHSGIDWDSFSVAFGEVATLSYEKTSGRWELNGNTLTLSLVTAEIVNQASTNVQLHYQVSVGDRAGNRSSESAAGVYYLDEQPPVLSLDPPTMRYRRITPTDACSHAFDPVGVRAINDGDSAQGMVWFRALVLDRTNMAAGQTLFKFSGVDSTSVRLYLSPASVDLVVDRNGDGVCDDARSEDPLTKVFDFWPVPPAGSPFFGDEAGDTLSGPPLGTCVYADPPAPTAPANLCMGQASDLSYVAAQSHGAGSTSVVFAPLVFTGLECTGSQIDVKNLLPLNYTGWACAAVVGRDYVGNRGVSAPISICIGGNCAGAPPACAGACEAPEIETHERTIKPI